MSTSEPGRGPLISEPELDEDRLADLLDDNDVEEDLWTDDSGEDYTGWYCVRTDPWQCPAEGCSFVAHFLTAAHLVIVWPELDDPSLLGMPPPPATWAATPRSPSTSPPSALPAPSISGRRRATRCTPSARTSGTTSTRRSSRRAERSTVG